MTPELNEGSRDETLDNRYGDDHGIGTAYKGEPLKEPEAEPLVEEPVPEAALDSEAGEKQE